MTNNIKSLLKSFLSMLFVLIIFVGGAVLLSRIAVPFLDWLIMPRGVDEEYCLRTETYLETNTEEK